MIASALAFPEIGPNLIAFEVLGVTLAIRWYALAYIVGLLVGWQLLVRVLRRNELWPGNQAPVSAEQVDDFLFWAIAGVIVGGRLGFVLGYGGTYFLENPADILKVWQGGMSFHGGFLGVVVAAFIFGLRRGLPLLSFADGLALATPVGLLLGRLSNFINEELWGKPTDVPWGVIFPSDAAQFCPGFDLPCARHPSQLYEAALEGALMLAVLLFLAYRRNWLKRPGRIAGLFFAGYGAARIFVEEFREADAQFITALNPEGHVVSVLGLGLSMGQLLSLPMLIAGLILMFRARAT